MTRSLADYRDHLLWALQDAGAPDALVAELGRLLDGAEAAEADALERRVATLINRQVAAAGARQARADKRLAWGLGALPRELPAEELFALVRRRFEARGMAAPTSGAVEEFLVRERLEAGSTGVPRRGVSGR